MWRCRVARGGALAVWGRTTGHAPVGSFGCLRPVEPWRAPCKAKSGHILLAWGIWPAVRGRSGCHLSTRALGARLGDWCRVLGLAGGALAVWGGTTEHIDVRRLCIHPPRGGSYRASLGGCTGADSPRRLVSRFQSRLKSPDGDGGLTTLVAAALHRPRAGEPSTPSAST